jgi:Xaa-Pro aminopeptidase
MAVDLAKKLKVADAFLNFGKGAHSKLIGHGIGLEVNEPPIISSYDTSEIGENFVMAVEMHMYREGIGVVKLEDTLLVGKDKNRVLTFSSRDLLER